MVAQFAFYVALLGPASFGNAVKVQTIVGPEHKAAALAQVASLGALCAVIANVVFVWVNPIRHRDFALAWTSNFLILMAIGVDLALVMDVLPDPARTSACSTSPRPSRRPPPH